MALVQYSRLYWFPNGAVAANTPAAVFPDNVNIFAPLYADAAGTVPLPNPLNTDGAGLLTFYAEEGPYWVHIDAETFHIDVGTSELRATLSTGIASGGRVTVNAGNPLAVDISALDGYIVDYSADDPTAPVVTHVKTPAQTVPLDAAALLRTATWFLMDGAGVITQQATPATNEQRRTHIAIGAAAQDGVQIFRTLPDATLLAQPVNQLGDLMDGLGLFTTRPIVVTPNANLTINTSASVVFGRSLNRYAGGLLTNNPHNVPAPAASPAQFRYITSTGSAFGPLTSNVDVTRYDVGGVPTLIPGGSNATAIHRLFVAGTGNAADQFAIQYGQTVYPNLATAIDRIGQSGFVTNPVLSESTALVAWIVATKATTNLSDPAQAVIISAGKFASP